MKGILLFVSATLFIGACNSKPNASNAKDTTPVNAQETAAIVSAAPQPAQAQKTTNKTTTEASKASTGSGTLSSEAANTAKAKKGWSKTAKGAVIGGVVGAGTGAVVNKKNRAVGAVVGGAVGAGAGAIIGNEMDQQDGRH